jgi:two-component system, NtrC family, sensor kinase
MSISPILVFALLGYLQRMLKNEGIRPDWQAWIKKWLIFTGVLFGAQFIFHIEYITLWFWHLSLIALCGFILTQPEFNRIRTMMYAVLPVVIISFLKDLIGEAQKGFLGTIADFLDIAYPFAIIWLVAMFFINNKQRKALEKERKQREEEEAQARIVAEQKGVLEVMVEERTAELTRQKEELQQTVENLKATQTQLVQSEKMASLGELTAGIAHEIQNPLNFVNNFSEVNTELAAELKFILDKLNVTDQVKEELIAITDDIVQNHEKILYHGKRADTIVKSMLQHSRTNNGQKEETDINALADEYLRLSYHGLRAKDKTFNAVFETDLDPTMGKIMVVPQDIGRVVLNLVNNAFYAVNEKKKTAGENYHPTIWLSTKRFGKLAIIKIKDNGNGMPDTVKEKIFQPFFTTKPTGKGTGLGLSLSYEIITKGHGGSLVVDTKEGEETCFTIKIPINS